MWHFADQLSSKYPYKLRDHPFKMSANYSWFLTPTPLLSAVFYYYPSANLAIFWPLPPKKCRRLKWMVPNVWTWLKLLCAQAENCQHYSEWGGYSSQEIGLTWLDLSGINEACLIDKEERGSLEGCKQKTFSTMDLYPIWRSIFKHHTPTFSILSLGWI